MRRRLLVSWVLFAATIATMLGLCFSEHLERAFFTHDAEAELLAVTSIADSGFTRLSIPWTAAYRTDPEALLPFGENFLTVHDHRLYASRPLVFVLLASVAYALGGMLGLYLLPALAGGAAIHLAYSVALRSRTPQSLPCPSWVVPAVAFATPVPFYSSCAWNMIVGAAFATAAVRLLLARGTLAVPLAGVAFGVGVGIRPELALLGLPLVGWGVFVLGFRRAAPLVAGALAAALGIAMLNHAAFGSILGPHVRGNEMPLASWLATRPAVFRDLFLRSLGGVWLEAPAAVAAIVALLPARLGWPGPRIRALALCTLALTATASAALSVASADPFAAALETHSVFAATPLLLLVPFFSAGEDERLRALRWLCIAFLLLAWLTCPPQAAHAAHFGPRILVVAVPLMAIVAVTAGAALLREIPGLAARLAIGALLLASVVDQAYGLRLLHFKQRESATFKADLARDELPIVAGEWVVPADLASWYPHRALWLPRGAEDLRRVFSALDERGDSRLLVLSRDGSPLDRQMHGLAAAGRLAIVERRSMRSRLFHYRGMSAVVYEVSR